MPTSILFIYGSLKKGFHNHKRKGLHLQKFLGTAKTAPSFKLLNFGDYPGLIAGSNSITGELYEVDEKCRKGLDRMEQQSGYSAAPCQLLEPLEISNVEVYMDSRGRDGRDAGTEWKNPPEIKKIMDKAPDLYY